VELRGRAVGKLPNPQTHILWNLDYLTEEEQNNADLKQLLDNLRVYSLFPYYLNNATREKAGTELAKVDWAKQSETTYKKFYKTPIIYLKVKQRIKFYGSWFKQHLLKKL
jgi:hypothetical protein